MLKVGDTVKVIGKTISGDGVEKEYIPIGSTAFVISTKNDAKEGSLVEISSNKNDDVGYWYLASDIKRVCSKKCKKCKYPCVNQGESLKPITVDELREKGYVLCDNYTEETLEETK